MGEIDECLFNFEGARFSKTEKKSRNHKRERWIDLTMYRFKLHCIKNCINMTK